MQHRKVMYFLKNKVPLGPMRSYPVKINPIGSTVSEILLYKQTDRQTHIQLLYYKDGWNVRNTTKLSNKSKFNKSPKFLSQRIRKLWVKYLSYDPLFIFFFVLILDKIIE